MESSTNWKKKMIALVTAITMATGVLPAAGAAVTTETTAPKVTVVAALVENGAFLEVGLNIDSVEKTFQSAGVVLRYDPSKLQPANWKAATEAEPELYKMTVLHSSDGADATPLANAWQRATPLPTKGADEMSGKLAKAFTCGGTAEAPANGYVMLSSERAEAGAMAQPLPGKADPTPEDIPTETASKLPLAYTGKAEAAVEQTVTVRFAVQKDANAEGEPLYALPALLDALDLVRYDGVDTSGTKTVLETAPLSLTPSDSGALDGVMYIADNAQYTAAGYDSAVQTGFHWIAQGVSVNAGTGGPADTSDFIAITMFDWDNTLIGTKLVARDANEEKQAELVQAAFDEVQTQYNSVFNSHAGYTFGCWIPYESNTPTAYGLRVQSTNANNLAIDDATAPDSTRQLNEPEDKVQTTQVKKDIALKAAYVASEESWKISQMSDRRYTIEPVDYGRYGTAGSVYIKIKIRRVNAANAAVPRPAKPALRVGMTVGGVTTYSLYPLTGADEEVVEVVPFATTTRGVTSLNFSVIDTFGVSNWVGIAGTRLDPALSAYTRGEARQYALDGSNRAVLLRGIREYLYECYLGWINALCEEHDPSSANYADLSAISNAELRTMGISVTNAGGIALIREKIYQAWFGKNSTNGKLNETFIDLTKREITEAIGTTSGSVFATGE